MVTPDYSHYCGPITQSIIQHEIRKSMLTWKVTVTLCNEEKIVVARVPDGKTDEVREQIWKRGVKKTIVEGQKEEWINPLFIKTVIAEKNL